MWRPAFGAIVALIAITTAILALNGPRNPTAVVVDSGRGSPTPGGTIVAAPSLHPPTVIPTLVTPSPLPSTVATGRPTSPPGNVATQPTPGFVATPRPQPTPAPTPKATPKSTATPAPRCTVPNLVGLQSSKAKGEWRSAGFTGTVIFSPDVPPHFEIGSQSLASGNEVACTRDITVAP